MTSDDRNMRSADRHNRGIADEAQQDANAGKQVGIAPIGYKTEGEIEADAETQTDEAARIDPDSRIPRPVQPDLA